MTDQKPSIEAIYEFYGLRIVGSGRSVQCKAECPLPDHDDINPSATVNTEEQVWFCFVCNRGGDGYDIVKEREQSAGWAHTQRFANSIAGSGDGGVRSERASSSLLPRRSGNRGERGAWTPPWGRL